VKLLLESRLVCQPFDEGGEIGYTFTATGSYRRLGVPVVESVNVGGGPNGIQNRVWSRPRFRRAFWSVASGITQNLRWDSNTKENAPFKTGRKPRVADSNLSGGDGMQVVYGMVSRARRAPAATALGDRMRGHAPGTHRRLDRRRCAPQLRRASARDPLCHGRPRCASSVRPRVPCRLPVCRPARSSGMPIVSVASPSTSVRVWPLLRRRADPCVVHSA